MNYQWPLHQKVICQRKIKNMIHILTCLVRASTATFSQYVFFGTQKDSVHCADKTGPKGTKSLVTTVLLFFGHLSPNQFI